MRLLNVNQCKDRMGGLLRCLSSTDLAREQAALMSFNTYEKVEKPLLISKGKRVLLASNLFGRCTLLSYAPLGLLDLR